MSPRSKVPPKHTIFLFEEGPVFRALDQGDELLRIDPKASKSYALAYRVVFALYGLPAKIVYNGPRRTPKDVDHLEYYPTHRDLMFVRGLKRILPKLSRDRKEGKDKLRALINNFYDDKLDTVKEWVRDLFEIPNYNHAPRIMEVST